QAWGVLPAERSVRAIEGEASDAGVLALEQDGAAIEGVVRLPFEARLGQLKVRAVRTSPEAREVETWRGLAFAGRRVAVRESVAEVSTQGAFRITGLEPGTYALELEGAGEAYVVPSRALEASAPSAGVVLGASYGRTQVHVSCA